MANIFAFHSVCRSIAAHLQAGYPSREAGVAMPACRFEVLSSTQMASPPSQGNRIGLYLYRVASDTRGRAASWSAVGAPDDARALPLDLHILVGAWGTSAHDEHVTLAWTVRQLHLHPAFGADALTSDAGWGANEQVQLVQSDLSLEDSQRIWGALQAPARLSVAYTVRSVRLHAPETDGVPPVVITPPGA